MLSATKVYFRISSRFAVLFCFMFVKRERERERENFEERKVMTATRKSNQIKNLLLLLSREKEKNRKGRRRDPHLFSFFNRDCGWVCGGGRGYHFDLKERCCCWKIPLFLMTWARRWRLLSLSLSLRHKTKTKKMCGCSLSSFGKKWEEKNTNLILHLSSFLQKLFK